MKNVLATVQATGGMLISEGNRDTLQNDFGQATMTEIREAWEQISHDKRMRRKFVFLVLEVEDFDTACDILGYTLIQDYQCQILDDTNEEVKALYAASEQKETSVMKILSDREAKLKDREQRCLNIASGHGDMLKQIDGLREDVERLTLQRDNTASLNAELMEQKSDNAHAAKVLSNLRSLLTKGA